MIGLLSFCLNGCWSHFPHNRYLGYHSCFKIGIMKGIFIIDFRIHDFMTGMCGDDALELTARWGGSARTLRGLKAWRDVWERCVGSRNHVQHAPKTRPRQPVSVNSFFRSAIQLGPCWVVKTHVFVLCMYALFCYDVLLQLMASYWCYMTIQNFLSNIVQRQDWPCCWHWKHINMAGSGMWLPA